MPWKGGKFKYLSMSKYSNDEGFVAVFKALWFNLSETVEDCVADHRGLEIIDLFISMVDHIRNIK